LIREVRTKKARGSVLLEGFCFFVGDRGVAVFLIEKAEGWVFGQDRASAKPRERRRQRQMLCDLGVFVIEKEGGDRVIKEGITALLGRGDGVKRSRV
jgi:hypothetical protein